MLSDSLLHMFSFLWGKYLGMEMLGHKGPVSNPIENC